MAICISSLEKCLFRSFAFFFILGFFFILSYMNCLYILEIPEAQLSWDRIVAVHWHPSSSLPPSGSTWEQKLSLYHKNVSAWSTAHA